MHQHRKQLNTTLNLIEKCKVAPIRKLLSDAARQLLELTLVAYGEGELTAQEINCLLDNSKLQAVKLFKDRTNCTLMEAKHCIEDYMVKQWGTKNTQEIPGL